MYNMVNIINIAIVIYESYQEFIQVETEIPSQGIFYIPPLYFNGTIDLLLNLDNRFAEKKIEVVFVVESLQTVGVEDPLANGIANAKYHEVWGT